MTETPYQIRFCSDCESVSSDSKKRKEFALLNVCCLIIDRLSVDLLWRSTGTKVQQQTADPVWDEKFTFELVVPLPPSPFFGQ